MSYYDTILARARAVSPNLLADDTLFQALLLALISNEKHLIVRTHEDSIARVSGQVVNILHGLFALSAIKLRFKPTDAAITASEFLRLLFLDTKAISSTHSHSHTGHAYGLANPVDDAVSRTSSRRTLAGSFAHISNASHAQSSAFRRSTSYPIAASPLSLAGGTAAASSLQHDAHATLGPPETHTQHKTPVHASTNLLLRAQTDPTPHAYLHPNVQPNLHPSAKSGSGTDFTNIELGLIPRAVVISGLESISEDIQLELWNILSERQITLSKSQHDPISTPQSPTSGSRTPKAEHRDLNVTEQNIAEGNWPLPTDFMLVYVCPIGDGCERPNVIKPLLDRFASSVEVVPPPTSEIAHDNRPPLSLSSPNESAFDETGPSPVLSNLELADLRILASPQHIHVGSREDLYLSDLFSGTRHHPHLDGSMLTARCRIQATHLLRANRALFGDPPEMIAEMDSEESEKGLLNSEIALSVTGEDVRRAFAQAVMHRLRVLEGPQQEILASLCFTAANTKSTKFEWAAGRRPITDIVKEVIESV